MPAGGAEEDNLPILYIEEVGLDPLVGRDGESCERNQNYYPQVPDWFLDLKNEASRQELSDLGVRPQTARNVNPS